MTHRTTPYVAVSLAIALLACALATGRAFADESLGETRCVELWWRLEVDATGKGTLREGPRSHSRSVEALLPKLRELVGGWKFEPARVGGKAVAGSTGLRIVVAARAVDAERIEMWIAGASVSPMPLKGFRPSYPESSYLARHEGDVVVEMTIAGTGRVRQAHVVESTGDQEMERGALEAARRWTFEPNVVDGQRVETRVILPISFSLRPPDGEAAERAAVREAPAVASKDHIQLLTPVERQPL